MKFRSSTPISGQGLLSSEGSKGPRGTVERCAATNTLAGKKSSRQACEGRSLRFWNQISGLGWSTAIDVCEGDLDRRWANTSEENIPEIRVVLFYRARQALDMRQERKEGEKADLLQGRSDTAVRLARLRGCVAVQYRTRAASGETGQPSTARSAVYSAEKLMLPRVVETE